MSEQITTAQPETSRTIVPPQSKAAPPASSEDPRYRLLFEHSRDIVLFIDRHSGRIVEANTAAIAAYGYSREELLALTIHDLRAEETRTSTSAQMAAADGGGILFETIHRRKDGRTFPVEVSSQGACIDGTRLLISVIRDITERQMAEEALRESEARCRVLIETSPDGMVLTALDGAVLMCNSRTVEMHGAGSPQQIVGRSAFDLIAAEEHELAMANLRRTLSEGTIRDVEYTLVRTDGSRFPGELSASLIRDAKGKPAFFVGITRDITQRKRAEEALAEHERLVKSVADASPNWLYIFDFDTMGIYFENRSLTRSLGYPPEVSAKVNDVGALRAFLPPDEQSHLSRTLEEWQGLADGAIRDDEYRLQHADGTIHSFAGREVVFARRPDDSVRQVLGLLLDITDRKRAEEQIRAAMVSAEEANQAKDHFLAVLSHELRTPLNPALMAAIIVEGSPQLPPDLRDDVGIIRRNVELEARLIDDMLDLTRIVRGKLILDRRIVDGREVIEHAIETCHAEAMDKNLALEVTMPAKPQWVDVDPARLQQVFWNLLKNAIKFTPPYGRIAIAATATARGGMRVEVRDTGKGIEAGMLSTIFNAFEQGSATVTKRYGGLGLGLAICRGLVSMHDGSISAQSGGIDRGATFVVELPPPTQGKEPAAQPKASRREAPVATVSGCHILLVEDHETTSVMTTRLLRSFGHQVTAVASVRAALEKSTEVHFDLVISDLGLPDGTGHDLIRELLARGPVPAIALSGYGMDADIQRSAEAGFLEHLVKPINARQLANAVDRALRKTHRRPASDKRA